MRRHARCSCGCRPVDQTIHADAAPAQPRMPEIVRKLKRPFKNSLTAGPPSTGARLASQKGIRRRSTRHDRFPRSGAGPRRSDPDSRGNRTGCWYLRRRARAARRRLPGTDAKNPLVETRRRHRTTRVSPLIRFRLQVFHAKTNLVNGVRIGRPLLALTRRLGRGLAVCHT